MEPVSGAEAGSWAADSGADSAGTESGSFRSVVSVEEVVSVMLFTGFGLFAGISLRCFVMKIEKVAYQG